jgi:NAD(P) transhydrogenase subunit alpha
MTARTSTMARRVLYASLMRIGVPKETSPGEQRVALTPDSVKRLIAKKLEVSIQRGAGRAAYINDSEYEAVGARIEPDAGALWRASDVILKVRPPSLAERSMALEGRTLISLLQPYADPERIRDLASRGVTCVAADLVPRTTLAQMMDVLSSQASIAGYRAVLLAAEACPKLFPMMMTAAGTIAPSRVLVLGAGVAGLQAVATARRLGAIVEVFDVRKVVKEQVESLGAKFIEVPSEEDGAGQGGYAKEVSEEYKRKQSELITAALGRADACITTALVPGKRAPTLVTTEQASAMRPGSVIVDLAAEQGGNCELTRPGARHCTERGVVVIGETDLPSQAAVHASQMFSKNLEKLVLHFLKEGELVLDPAADEIAKSMLVCRGGEVVHPQIAAAVEAAQKELAA